MTLTAPRSERRRRWPVASVAIARPSRSASSAVLSNLYPDASDGDAARNASLTDRRDANRSATRAPRRPGRRRDRRRGCSNCDRACRDGRRRGRQLSRDAAASSEPVLARRRRAAQSPATASVLRQRASLAAHRRQAISRLPAPPAFGSPAFLAGLAEVRHISDTRTADQLATSTSGSTATTRSSRRDIGT